MRELAPALIRCGIATLVLISSDRAMRAQQMPLVTQQQETLAPSDLAMAEGQPLTLEIIVQLALEQNPTLIQAGAQRNISNGKAVQAGLYPNPTVGYTAEQIGANGTAGELQGLFVQQEIVRGGKLQLSRAKYREEAVQAQIHQESQQFRVVASVRKAFYYVLAAQRQVQLLQELLRNAEDALTTTRELVNVGQANQPDLLQAEVQANRIRAELRGAEHRLRGHWLELTAYMGLPDFAPQPLSGDLEISNDEILDERTLLDEILQSSPQLRAACSEVKRDRIAVQREFVEPIPNIQLRGETGHNFESQDTVAGVSVGVRLPINDRNQGSIAQARAELCRAEAEVSRVELMLRKKFAAAFAEYSAALELAAIQRATVLPKAREAYESYREAFQNRRAAWPQVLVAQREYFQLSDEYIEQLLAARLAEADIEGFFLGDGLDQPPTPTPQGHREATPKPR